MVPDLPQEEPSNVPLTLRVIDERRSGLHCTPLTLLLIIAPIALIMYIVGLVTFILLFGWYSATASSLAMPPCETKEDCNRLWNAPSVSSCINETCQCTGDSLYVAKDKTCGCREGHVIGSKRCLLLARNLASSCGTDNQCTVRSFCEEDIQCSKMGPLAICDSFQCYCKSGTTDVNGICRVKKYAGESCQLNAECQHVDDLLCKNKVCTCDKGFIATIDGKMCLKLLTNFWDPCIDNIQCELSFGEGSRCSSKCICKNDYHIVNNTACVKNKGLGEKCSSDSECYLETDMNGITFSCHEGICTCKSGYHSSSDKLNCLEGDASGAQNLQPLRCAALVLLVATIACLRLTQH